MSKFKSRICCFIVIIAMLVFVLPASVVIAQTAKAKALSDAIFKTNMVTSGESNGKLNLTVKAEGLSKQDLEDFAGVSDFINDFQVSYNTKTSGNSEGTILKQYVNMSANVGGSPYSGELWSDINLTGTIPVVKGIVKSPQIFEMMLDPQYMDKYMLVDFQQIKEMPEMQAELGSMDFGKMITENKELQQLLLNLTEKYSSQLHLDYRLVSNDGNVYKVKIDDSKFKDIISKVVNLTAKNKDVQNSIKDLITIEMKNSGASTGEINSTKDEMQQMFTSLESQEFLDEFNQTMDKLKEVKILGDKGIEITYTIDENGYVKSTKGDIELVADMEKLDKVFSESSTSTITESVPSGSYTAGIHFEVNNSNINGQVNVELPILTSSNSFNMMEILEAIEDPQPEIVEHTVTGGQLPNTSTHLFELLLIGAALTLVGVLGFTSRKHYE